MTRPTWDGTEPIPDGPPKDFDELVEDYQRDHYPRLWEALEAEETAFSIARKHAKKDLACMRKIILNEILERRSHE